MVNGVLRYGVNLACDPKFIVKLVARTAFLRTPCVLIFKQILSMQLIYLELCNKTGKTLGSWSCEQNLFCACTTGSFISKSMFLQASLPHYSV